MNDLYHTNYTAWLENYNEAWRYMEWESQHHPWNGDNRTPLQRKMDSMSLYDAWNCWKAHYLRNKVELDAAIGYDGEDSRKAQQSLENGDYKAANPYRNGGDKVFVGDYVYDEYGFLMRHEGWYRDGSVKMHMIGYGRKTFGEARKIALKDGKRLFSRSAEKVYMEIELREAA